MTTSPSSRAECNEIWEPKPPGTLWATLGLLWDCFTFNTKHILFYLPVPIRVTDSIFTVNAFILLAPTPGIPILFTAIQNMPPTATAVDKQYFLKPFVLTFGEMCF
jgi:hypothetical protein